MEANRHVVSAATIFQRPSLVGAGSFGPLLEPKVAKDFDDITILQRGHRQLLAVRDKVDNCKIEIGKVWSAASFFEQ